MFSRSAKQEFTTKLLSVVAVPFLAKMKVKKLKVVYNFKKVPFSRLSVCYFPEVKIGAGESLLGT